MYWPACLAQDNNPTHEQQDLGIETLAHKLMDDPLYFLNLSCPLRNIDNLPVNSLYIQSMVCRFPACLCSLILIKQQAWSTTFCCGDYCGLPPSGLFTIQGQPKNNYSLVFVSVCSNYKLVLCEAEPGYKNIHWSFTLIPEHN